MVIRCRTEPSRIVCIREIQDSIRESVRQLIVDKIHKHRLETWFNITEHEIRAPNGSLIIFKGMQNFNAENIKSLEGYDVAWVEEAQTLSERSLRMLRPTIRKPGSELWFSWNPRHDTDAVDAFLRGPHKPKDAIVVEVNWYDNPWFPAELRAEMDRDYAADEEMAEHVWGGGYELVSEGTYYARLISDAERQGRVGHFPHNPARLVRTGWDLGLDDYTSIWFVQDDGLYATVIDYYETAGDGLDDIVATCMPEIFEPPPHDEKWRSWDRNKALQDFDRPIPFRYGAQYLPHDIAMREIGNGARSRIFTLTSLGVKTAKKGIRSSPEDRIAATRQLLPIVRFNNTPRVALGMKRLRRYSRKLNEVMGVWQPTAKHDENSHGADAIGEFAMNAGLVPDKPVEPERPKHLVLEAKPNGIVQANMSVREIIEMKKRQRLARLNG